MVTASDILRLAQIFAAATGIKVTTISSRVFDDSKKLSAIESGADLTLTRAITAMQWFSDNWPDGEAWPDDMVRPAPSAPSSPEAA